MARVPSSWRELPGERGEVRVDLGAGRELSLVEGFAPLPGEHQHRPRLRRGCRFHIAPRVAHHADIGERDIEAPRDLEQHARLGLAAIAGRAGGVGAEEESIDAAAGLRGRALHRVVDRDQRRGVEKAARNARLVGRHHHAVARLGEPRDGLETAVDRAPFGDRFYVRVAVLVDGAVAFQDDELHFSTASLEMSATWFMKGSSLCGSSAWRLARTFRSSALTSTLLKKAVTKGSIVAVVCNAFVNSPASMTP